MTTAMADVLDHPLGPARGYNPAFYARATERRAEARSVERAARARAKAEAHAGYGHFAGDARAADAAPPQPAAGITGEDLSLDQCAILYLIGLHGGARGGPGCGLPETMLADLASMDHAAADSIIVGLVVAGMIVSARPSIRAGRMRRLTDAGQAVFSVLFGEVGT